MTTGRNYHWPQPDEATRREHRVNWFVWGGVADDFGIVRQTRIPHASSMRDPDYDRWDAECTCCQWESKTGGRPKSEIQDLIGQHRAEAQWQKMCARGLVPARLLGCDGPLDPAVLGEGILRWSRAETVSGRYGTVMLQAHDEGPFIYPAAVPEGRYGVLAGEFLEEPEIGITGVPVGEGYIFRSRSNGYPAVGVRPRLDLDVTDEQAGRAWMDRAAIECLGGQLVRLVFFPAAKDGAA